LKCSNTDFQVLKKKLWINGFFIWIVDTPRVASFSHSELLVSQMQIWQVVLLINDLPQAIVFSLKTILCHEKSRSRVWCPDHGSKSQSQPLIWRAPFHICHDVLERGLERYAQNSINKAQKILKKSRQIFKKNVNINFHVSHVQKNCFKG